jgi:polyisoprenyl-phosphate glycosyltransferase
MVNLSIVIPVYGCASCLIVLNRRLTQVIKKITAKYEILYIDDHSHDNAWEIIKNLHKSDHHVTGIRLSRNFGQHHAITAGIDRVQGKWTIVMDCDLQDPPEDIPLLYEKAQKGYDVVFARRANRQDGITKKLSARIFHNIFALVSGMDGDPSIGNFGIYSRVVIDHLKINTEQNRSFLQEVKWLGFKQTAINISPNPRLVGSTGYNFNKLIKYAVDCITAYSNLPLWLPIYLGLFLVTLSIISIILLVTFSLLNHLKLSAVHFFLTSLSFLSGLTLTAIGIVGIYLAKIFDEVRHRPLYIIEDSIGL